jgi:hypothetical protein
MEWQSYLLDIGFLASLKFKEPLLLVTVVRPFFFLENIDKGFEGMFSEHYLLA